MFDDEGINAWTLVMWVEDNNQIPRPRSYHFQLHILYFIENYIYDDLEYFTQYFCI